MSPSDFAPRCCRCRQALVPTPPLPHFVDGPYYCAPCAELIARAPEEAPRTYVPIGPEQLDAALGRLDYLDKVATEPPWQREFGFNNGGVATAYLKVPGHGLGAMVEMIAEDAELIALSRATLRLMLDEIKRLRAAEIEACGHVTNLQDELVNVRRQRVDLLAEASRLRAIAAVSAPHSLLIEEAKRDDGARVIVLCAPDAETELALAELMFEALSAVGVRMDPATKIERTGVTAIEAATDLLAKTIEEERKDT